jgi:hypothetical protein
MLKLFLTLIYFNVKQGVKIGVKVKKSQKWVAGAPFYTLNCCSGCFSCML